MYIFECKIFSPSSQWTVFAVSGSMNTGLQEQGSVVQTASGKRRQSASEHASGQRETSVSLGQSRAESDHMSVLAVIPPR